MDDRHCLKFFRQPNDALHRHYEVLRAFFVERLPAAQIAEQFGYRTASVYALVRDFRAQAQAGQIPPFSLHPRGDGPVQTTSQCPTDWKPRRSPMLAP